MVREAATLNLMFLSDLSGLEPLPPVRVLVTSFEACTDDRHAAAASPSGDDIRAVFPPHRITPVCMRLRVLVKGRWLRSSHPSRMSGWSSPCLLCAAPWERLSARPALFTECRLTRDVSGAAASATLPAPGRPCAPAADAADGAHEERRLQTQDLLAALRLEVRLSPSSTRSMARTHGASDQL